MSLFFPTYQPEITLKLDQFKPLEFPGFPADRLPTTVPAVTPGNLLSPETWTFSVPAEFMTIPTLSRNCLVNQFI